MNGAPAPEPVVYDSFNAYDPREFGAKCDVCPLGPAGCLREEDGPVNREPWLPVPSEFHTGRHRPADVGALVADAPGPTEVEEGRPLCGPAGVEYDECLTAAGQRRTDLALINVIACKPVGPPGGAWSRMMNRLSKLRRDHVAQLRADDDRLTATEAKRAAWEAYPDPAACCRPRFEFDLDRFTNIIPVGSTALRAVTGEQWSISSRRGGPLYYDSDGFRVTKDAPNIARKLLPTFHPGFVANAPAWRDVFTMDIAKAFRLFNDKLNWVEPERLHNPTPDELEAWLMVSAPFWTVDTETSGIDPMGVVTYCVTIATPDIDERGEATADPDRIVTPSRTVGILIRSRETGELVYNPDDELRIWWLIIWLLSDPTRRVWGHNLLYYDLLVIASELDRTQVPLRDEMVGRLQALANMTLDDALRFMWDVPADQPAPSLIRSGYDSLFLAHGWRPDVPKGLKVHGPIWTDVGRWESDEKGEKTATSSKVPDNVLLLYGEDDTVVNARIQPPLVERCAARGVFEPLRADLEPEPWARVSSKFPTSDGVNPRPWTLFEVSHGAQALCVDMHKTGIPVDEAQRQKLEVAFAKRVAVRRARLQEMGDALNLGSLSLAAADDSAWDDVEDESDVIDDDAVNPGAYGQLRELLYGKWALGCPPRMDERAFFTDTGLPGTGDAVLRAHLASGLLSDLQARYINELRLYRRERNKILGTVIRRLAPRTNYAAELAAWKALPAKHRGLKPVQGLVQEDGRLHPSWNAAVTAPGRLSCNRMNVQNIGNKKGQQPLMTLFAAPPGYAFIGVDLDQAHLRIIANVWQIQTLRKVFLEGYDPHGTLAHALFGDAYLTASGWGPGGPTLKGKPEGGDAKAMRDPSKVFRYSSCYLASPDTIWQVMTSTESKDGGSLPYLHYRPEQIAEWHEAWLEAEPDWLDAWQWHRDQYERYGYITGYLSGRRSGNLKDGNESDVVNVGVLDTEAFLMRLAECSAMDAFPPGFDGPGTGIVAQVHDSIKVLVKDRGEDYVKAQAMKLQECCTLRIPGHDIPYTAEPHWGRTFAELG